MKIGVLVPTRGDRPAFLTFCINRIKQQTLSPDFISIVDFVPHSTTGDLTLRYRTGIKELSDKGADLILFIEDDDWYHPEYIETVVQLWKENGKPDIFGFNSSLYYHIGTNRLGRLFHRNRSSMFCTCIATNAVNSPEFEWPADDYPFLDLHLWKKLKGASVDMPFHIAIGIKHGIGLCGGRGHISDSNLYDRTDSEFQLLESLIGEQDVEFYRSIMRPVITNGKKLKFAIVTGVWKRPEVFEMFAESIHILKKTVTTAEIICIVAGSEGSRSRKMVERHGFIYIETKNDPLANKMNQTTLKARDLRADYVLCVGSDDIISPELFNRYLKSAQSKVDFLGVTDFYFYDTTTKRGAYWGGYRDSRKGHTAGAGRLLSARLMQEFNWSPWQVKDSRVLDDSMQRRLAEFSKKGFKISSFNMRSEKLFGLDIKSAVNMTPFELWDNTYYLSAEEMAELKTKFPYIVQ